MMSRRKIYLWEIIQEEQREKEKQTLEISDRCCNFCEVIEKNKIDITHRFSKEFEPYLEYLVEELQYIPSNELDNIYKQIEDRILRCLGTLDLLRGMSKKEVLKYEQLLEIEKSINLSIFSSDEKDVIAHFYMKMKKIGNDFFIFLNVIKRLFYGYELYQYDRTTLVWIPVEKTDENVRKMSIIQEMFGDTQIPIRIFWKYYFGEIGTEQKMKIGSIEIY